MSEMRWNTLVSNEIWSCDGFFSEEWRSAILREMKSVASTELQPSAEIRDKFRKTGANPTLYSYKVHQTTIRENNELSDWIMSRMGQLLVPMGYPDPKNSSYNPLQIFVKSFTKNSFYEMHTEPASLYGEFAYLIFLDTVEKGGELVFPDRAGANDYLEKYPGQRMVWAENVRLVENEKGGMRYVGPLTIKPTANRAVVFRVGSAHFVEHSPYLRCDERVTVAGWPYATPTLLAGLNKNCHIDNYFEPQKDLN